ncbi:Hypothetical predicted protein [Pelobates cultripes]|uniref:Uncharacterized protein n=1 Tax=Pelobates cultripes TaxID=61616 RepID=A0AAD1W9A5_PELCU|nr:Hypothetical predicted protein [Pelobates cultripes]
MQTQLSTLQESVDHQNSYLQALHRSLDDVDNRVFRNNLRICSLPENEQEDIYTTLCERYSLILDKPLDNSIPLDRAHRALKPTGTVSDKPKDVI